MPDLGEFLNQFALAGALIANTWWLWAPPALFFIAREMWRLYLKIRYFANLKWVLLEVKIPRDIAKTPEAMEQVFAGLQTMYFGLDFDEVWWLGLQHDYIVFEMASLGGETRFYVRTPVFFRNVAEAHIYAQYPEAEIAEAADYMDLLPAGVPSAEWDLFGIEFKLEREDAYPIRTYRDFQAMAPGAKEVEKVDPFSSIAELFGRIRPGEHLGYHLLFRPAQTPTPDAWRKKGEALVAKLIGRKEKPKKGKIAEALEPLAPLGRGWGEPLRPLFGLGPAAPAKPERQQREESGETSLMLYLSPGTREIVAAIERNIVKPGFEVVIRFCYAARRDAFSLSHLSAFIGALKQYNTQTLNAFKMNGAAMATSTPWWYPPAIRRRRKRYKQRLFWAYYRARKPFVDTVSLKSTAVVLNSEELATIYHYPGLTAKAPLLPRLESRRAEPPATLPVG